GQVERLGDRRHPRLPQGGGSGLAVLPDQHLLLVGACLEAGDRAARRLLLLAQGGPLPRPPGGPAPPAEVVEGTTARRQRAVVRRLDRQAEDAVLDAVHVHLQRGRLLLRRVAGGLVARLLGRLLRRLVRGLVGGAALVVLQLERRLGLLAQRHQ